MALKRLLRERFREHVGRVVVGGRPLDYDVALGNELADFQPAPLDVPRPLATSHVLREAHRAAVVDLEHGRLGHVNAHLSQQAAVVHYLARGRRGRHDLGLGARVGNAHLTLAAVLDGGAAIAHGKAGGRVVDRPVAVTARPELTRVGRRRVVDDAALARLRHVHYAPVGHLVHLYCRER